MRIINAYKKLKLLLFKDEYDILTIFKNSIVITGFQGFGLTGYIATKHVVNKLKAERVGCIILPNMSDVAFMDSGKRVALPHEIYVKTVNNKNIVIILNNALPHPKDYNIYAMELTKLLKESDISLLILIGGLSKSARLEGEKYELRCAVTSSYKGEIPAPLLESNLYIVGPLALLLIYAEMFQVPAITILPYCEIMRPDPRAAAVAVSVLSKLLGFNIDVTELYLDDAKIQEEFKRISELRQRYITQESREVTTYM